MSAPQFTLESELVARRDDRLQAVILDALPLRLSSGEAIRAGSALLASGSRLLLVQDDAWAAAWLEPETGALRPLILHGSGAALSKPDKPDLEAAFFLNERRICLLGSGATPQREVAVLIDLVDDAIVIRSLTDLYANLASALAMRPNIEGGLCHAEQLLLLHRGSGGAPSALCHCNADVLEGATARVSVRPCALGEINAVPLSFTDAADLDGQRFAYLAVAEDTPDAVADGPVVGMAIGLMERGGGRWTVLREGSGRPSRRKAEGLVIDSDRRHGWLITDPDDGSQPAELCRLALEGFD